MYSGFIDLKTKLPAAAGNDVTRAARVKPQAVKPKQIRVVIGSIVCLVCLHLCVIKNLHVVNRFGSAGGQLPTSHPLFGFAVCKALVQPGIILPQAAQWRVLGNLTWHALGLQLIIIFIID